jgi:hypothetical protein
MAWAVTVRGQGVNVATRHSCTRSARIQDLPGGFKVKLSEIGVP